ncbi:hypothetical protein DM01DRAFT_1292516 [Hesseltinella vesiculosa]|uniref:Xylanolytic transcriptional activator regulatory domain-containing protein n=1 Tax=Hesseltinella vesiculosa TaxID=101127 RepID=A0A1X2G8J6_9FUNG|nr:hypothetical protein DM01DRAFT_1292516 [Hesseltinella vesiculosa]
MDANGQYRYLGKASGFYLLQNSRTYHDGAFHLSGSTRSAPGLPSPTMQQKSSSVDPFELPPSDLSTDLIVAYFEHFYPILPMFYKQRLSSSLDEPAMAISPLLLNAIYCLASRVSNDPRVIAEPGKPESAGELYFERAKLLLDNYYDVPSISTVQALLLLACHQQGTMKSARAWLYGGLAFRMALDLGLNRNCDHWHIPDDEKERRKRVFWCCFVMDRLASANYGRTSTFEESDCDVPFPLDDDDEPLFPPSFVDYSVPTGGQMLILSHLVRICDILGHILKNFYYVKAFQQLDLRSIEQTVATLDSRLDHWFRNLPPLIHIQLDTIPHDMPVCALHLHLVYHTTLILLHRQFIPSHDCTSHRHCSTSSQLSSADHRCCLNSAKAIMSLANHMLTAGKLRYCVNSVVYYMFTAGIMFIHEASNSDPQCSFDAKMNVNNMMRILDTLSTTWPSARRCSNILGELAGVRELDLPTSENTLRPIVHNRQQQQPTQITDTKPPLPPVANTDISSLSPTSTTPAPSPFLTSDTQRNPLATKETNDLSMDIFTALPTSSAAAMNRNGALVQGDTADMDPFAAPDSIPTPSFQRHFDPLAAAFWGMPPSLDMQEWSNYLGSQLSSPAYSQQQQSSLQPPLASTFTSQINKIASSTPASPTSSVPTASAGNNAASPYLIPTRNLIPPLQAATPAATSSAPKPPTRTHFAVTSKPHHNLIHGDGHVDVLSGMTVPLDMKTYPRQELATLITSHF